MQHKRLTKYIKTKNLIASLKKDIASIPVAALSQPFFLNNEVGL